MCPSPSALLRRATVYYHMDKFQMAAEDLRVVLKEEPHNPAATVGHISLYMQEAHRPAGVDETHAQMFLFQKLLAETEKKLNEGQPVKQSKRIIIQEVEEDGHSKNEDMTEASPVRTQSKFMSVSTSFILLTLPKGIALLALFSVF